MDITHDNKVFFEFHPRECFIKDQTIRTTLLHWGIKDGLFHILPPSKVILLAECMEEGGAEESYSASTPADKERKSVGANHFLLLWCGPGHKWHHTNLAIELAKGGLGVVKGSSLSRGKEAGFWAFFSSNLFPPSRFSYARLRIPVLSFPGSVRNSSIGCLTIVLPATLQTTHPHH